MIFFFGMPLNSICFFQTFSTIFIISCILSMPFWKKGKMMATAETQCTNTKNYTVKKQFVQDLRPANPFVKVRALFPPWLMPLEIYFFNGTPTFQREAKASPCKGTPHESFRPRFTSSSLRLSARKVADYYKSEI